MLPNPPLIGITAHSRNAAGEVILPGTYIDAIQAAGGNTIVLPCQPNVDRLLDAIDGVVFSGGGDIDPLLYNGEEHPMVYGIDDHRDAFELELAKAALTRNIPTLGICRGLQMLTIAAGGDLIPHVPDVYGNTIDHRIHEPLRPIGHDLAIFQNTHLSKILATSDLHIVSWHHQAVKTVPPGWQISAQAEDGVIEAIERPDHPWMIAVQWHPELSATVPAHQRLFRNFVEAAGARSHMLRAA